MNILVLGATGATGKAVVLEALSRGHFVTALVRSPEKLMDIRNSALQIIGGDLLSSTEQANCLKTPQDTVISVIGSHSLKRTTIREDIAKATVIAMKQKRVEHIIALSAGIVDSNQLIPRILGNTLLRNVARDLKGMERVIMNDDLHWTILRASKLSNKAGNHLYKINKRGRPGGAFTARMAIAQFMIDEAEQKKYPRSILGISNG